MIPDSYPIRGHWADDWGRTFSIQDLLDSWTRGVEHIRDAGKQTDDLAWNADDYVAAMFSRDRLERVVSNLEGEQQQRVRAIAKRADERLILMTEMDRAGLVAIRGDIDPPADAWWWRRIPRSGSIRWDFEGTRED